LSCIRTTASRSDRFSWFSSVQFLSYGISTSTKPLPLPVHFFFQFIIRQSSYHSMVYRVTQKSVKLKYSELLLGMFRIKPVIQFIERYNSIVNCLLNELDLISNNFYEFRNSKEIYNALQHTLLTS
jgi:hypothetical protein